MINIVNIDEHFGLLLEAMPKIFNKLDASAKKRLVLWLGGSFDDVVDGWSNGFDLQNLPEPKELKNLNNFEKLYKDENIILIAVDSNNDKIVAVATDGSIWFADSEHYCNQKALLRPVQKFANNADKFYYIQVDKSFKDARQQKQMNRANAQGDAVALGNGTVGINKRLAEKRLNDLDDFMGRKVPDFGRKLLKFASRRTKDFKLFSEYVEKINDIYFGKVSKFDRDYDYSKPVTDKRQREDLLVSIRHLSQVMADLAKKYDIKY